MQVKVPVYDENGNIEFTATMNEKEVQTVLQFGLNVAISMGITSQLLSPESLEAPTTSALN